MKPEEITSVLTKLYGAALQELEPGAWQVETGEFRLLVLLSGDRSWLRLLLPIAPAQEALPFAEQLLAANFDDTQETRYAVHQNVLWGVFQHRLDSLTPNDLEAAAQNLVSLHEQGLSKPFNDFVSIRVSQIIQMAKRQGQSLEATMQQLNHFYQEGLMGDLEQDPAARDQVLAAWKRQLERLWPEVEP
jgi:hypothetical protein